MRTDRNPPPSLKQRLLQWAIAIAGVAAILASSGGGSGPSCAFLIPGAPCPPSGGGGIPLPAPPPSVSLTPAYQVTQVGMPVTFDAHVANLYEPTYAWCRAASADAECAPLPGISGSSYTIPATAMSDDGARYRVTATGTQGSATSAYSALHVSSMPPVVFEDGEFLEPDWVVTSNPGPAAGVPTFSLSRQATGGNPGAFLRETYDLPATVGEVDIYHGKPSATYYPASQGAIYLIEFAIDCKSAWSSSSVTYSPMVEQGGRRFAYDNLGRFYCASGSWRGMGGLLSTQLISGPACGPGETCPDYSALAAPLQFGFMILARSASPGHPEQVVNDYDNWKVKVWRR